MRRSRPCLQAEELKNEGNVHFKARKYPVAIEWVGLPSLLTEHAPAPPLPLCACTCRPRAFVRRNSAPCASCPQPQYTKAIDADSTVAPYYCNRAFAYLKSEGTLPPPPPPPPPPLVLGGGAGGSPLAAGASRSSARGTGPSHAHKE